LLSSGGSGSILGGAAFANQGYVPTFVATGSKNDVTFEDKGRRINDLTRALACLGLFDSPRLFPSHIEEDFSHVDP